MMRNLRELKDFHLFELTPVKATYVRGFAQAYHINGSQLNEINHIRDRGHGKSSLKASAS
jgi:putative heme iron utilization protein